jgi:hypothetical protein
LTPFDPFNALFEDDDFLSRSGRRRADAAILSFLMVGLIDRFDCFRIALRPPRQFQFGFAYKF